MKSLTLIGQRWFKRDLSELRTCRQAIGATPFVPRFNRRNTSIWRVPCVIIVHVGYVLEHLQRQPTAVQGLYILHSLWHGGGATWSRHVFLPFAFSLRLIGWFALAVVNNLVGRAG
jgi:hypothetical protein